MKSNWYEEYTMKNGSVLVSILDYLGDDDFYAMYHVIEDIIKPDHITFGVDSMGIDGSFRKDGLLVRMSSESAYDQCCFLYDPSGMSDNDLNRVRSWINDIIEELHVRLPR